MKLNNVPPPPILGTLVSFTQEDETIQVLTTTVKVLRNTFIDTLTCPQAYSFKKKLKKVEICHFYEIFSKGGLVKSSNIDSLLS
jgi:hypothetical protein